MDFRFWLVSVKGKDSQSRSTGEKSGGVLYHLHTGDTFPFQPYPSFFLDLFYLFLKVDRRMFSMVVVVMVAVSAAGSWGDERAGSSLIPWDDWNL